MIFTNLAHITYIYIPWDCRTIELSDYWSDPVLMSKNFRNRILKHVQCIKISFIIYMYTVISNFTTNEYWIALFRRYWQKINNHTSARGECVCVSFLIVCSSFIIMLNILDKYRKYDNHDLFFSSSDEFTPEQNMYVCNVLVLLNSDH